jgi:type II secretory pathway predicted ATPase ExeA
MDRNESHSRDWGRQLQVHDSLPVVFSRRRALERLRGALCDGEIGPVLITGEAGSGKTWLAHRFAGQLPTGWRALRVELGAALNALEFLRLIGHSLGVSVGNRLGAARLRSEAALNDEAAEGRRWLLVIDEAHRGSPSVWDEIQAIVNRQGRTEGFGAVFIVGRTALARALSTTTSGGFALGLLAHLHLLPLDLDEARDLLGGEKIADEGILEELHRDAQGNAALLLRLARSRSELWQPIPAAAPHHLARPAADALERSPSAVVKRPDVRENEVEPVSQPETRQSLERPSRVVRPPLIPTKPPLRIEEGLVEVGWDGDLTTEVDEGGDDDESASSETIALDEQSYNEELIEDRYAALQARAEQTRNLGRPAELAEDSDVALAQKARVDAEETEEEPGAKLPAHTKAESALPASGIRAEGQHEFAPYSQLFTRLRQSKQ